MKRLLVVPVVVMFMLAAFVPASSAADSANVVFMGQGQSSALDLSLPILNNLPILGTVLGSLGNLAKGLTVGHTESVFEGLNNASANGLAVGVCSLLGNNLLSLPATGGQLPGNLPALGGLPTGLGTLCSGTTQATSASTADHGSTTAKCQELKLAILVIKTACAQSYSTVEGGRPISQNSAGVAEVDVALLPDVLGSLGLNQLLGTLGLGNLGGGATGTVGSLPIVGPLANQLVGGLLGPVLQGNLGQVLSPAQNNDLLGAVTGLLQQVLGNAGNLLTLQLGTGTSVVSANGAATQETSQAAGAHIGLIANLIQIDIGAAQSTVVWNDATGQATADASPAVAHIKIANPLGGGSLLDLPVALPSLNQLLGGLLTQSDQAGNLTILAGTPLETTIKVASATPHSVGRNVTASSDGLSILALKGLGASSPAAMDGGIRLRLASSSASVAGDVLKVQAAAPSLPITGGPTYVFLAGAAILAVAAAHVLRNSRKLRSGVKA